MILRLILGDQLNENHSWFEQVDDQNIYVLMEMRQETDYVKHHIQKVVAFFSAMRGFEKNIKNKGHKTHYIKLDSSDNKQSLEANLNLLIEQYKITQFQYQLPDEYRLDQQLIEFCKSLDIKTEAFDTEHFMSSRKDLSEFYEGKKQYIMEFFYRNMRKKFDLLVEGGQPVGGQWNFDKNNRNKWKGSPEIPNPYLPKNEKLGDIYQMIVKAGIKTLGTFDENHFLFPSNRTEAIEQLNYFCEKLLIHFGDYQDAMIEGEPWMYHSHISFYLNCGLLLPLECVQAAENAYYAGKAPLNAVEGFIRQIIGWREYVRGIYWLHMPSYKEKNFFAAERALPSLYWTGKTKMNCLRQCVLETKENAYAHHIQRLMVLGNFALLAGIEPKQVNEWFLVVYADAYEWVELPNVTGMILFADGGYLASKPYAAGGSYINKMSNYCKSCSYKVTQKNGPDACPFNYLYWDFLDRNRDRLASNHRIGMMYKTFGRMTEEKQQAIRDDSRIFLSNLE